MPTPPMFAGPSRKGGQAEVHSGPKVSDAQIDALDIVRKYASQERRAVQRDCITDLDAFVHAMQTGSLPK